MLLRPQFAHKVVYYAAKKGFWVYVPTNGRLMRPDVIDRLGDAGVATINLAVDSVEDRPELPKALTPIRPYFDYLIKKQYRLRLQLFLQHQHLADQSRGREAADRNRPRQRHRHRLPHQRVADDRTAHFKHMDGNSTFITPEDWPASMRSSTGLLKRAGPAIRW